MIYIYINILLHILLLVILGYATVYLIMFAVVLGNNIIEDFKSPKINHVVDNGSRLTIKFNEDHKFIFNGQYEIIPVSNKMIFINIAPYVDILVLFDQNLISFVYEFQTINSVKITSKEAKIIKNFYNL